MSAWSPGDEPKFPAPEIPADSIRMGQALHPVVALTVTPYGQSSTIKVRWSLQASLDVMAMAEVWTHNRGWVVIWQLRPQTEFMGKSAEERAASATAAFKELEPYVNLILEP